MGGIGDEAALSFQAVTHAAQQAIDGMYERPDLGGQCRLVHRVQLLLVALVDFRRQPGDGTKQLAHQVGDHQQQDREQYQQGKQAAPGALAGVLVTAAGFLRHGDAFAGGGGFHQHAEGLAVQGLGRQAIGKVGRQRQRQGGIGVTTGLAAVGQVLDDDARLLVIALGGNDLLGVAQRHVLALEQRGNVAQAVVLDFQRFIEGRGEGEDAGDDCHRQDGQRQGDGQA